MDDGVEGWDIVGEYDLGGLDDPGGGRGSVDAGGEKVLGIADGGEIQDARSTYHCIREGCKPPGRSQVGNLAPFCWACHRVAVRTERSSVRSVVVGEFSHPMHPHTMKQRYPFLIDNMVTVTNIQ
jgi:hypothetical protein